MTMNIRDVFSYWYQWWSVGQQSNKAITRMSNNHYSVCVITCCVLTRVLGVGILLYVTWSTQNNKYLNTQGQQRIWIYINLVNGSALSISDYHWLTIIYREIKQYWQKVSYFNPCDQAILIEHNIVACTKAKQIIKKVKKNGRNHQQVLLPHGIG